MRDVYHLADEGVGYLDMREFNKARWAWEQSHPASPFMGWLKIAGHINFAPDNVRVSGSNDPALPIPATKLAWEEITRIANEIYTQFNDLEPAARDTYGQFLLSELCREVQTAWHRWPIEDKPHKVDTLRCGGCERLTLMYRPPRFEGDHLIVNCECGYALAEGEFELAVELIAKEEKEKRKTA